MSSDSRASGPGAVIVSGGASGLGAAVVEAVRAAGGRPYVLDLKPPAADVPYVAVDLADTRAAEEATRQLAEQAGEVHGVVTAAGMDVPAPLSGISGADWDRIVAVNLLGTAAVIRSALPWLERSHGNVVTVASTLGIKAVGDATAYCAAKFGVVGFTRALAAELAGRVGVTLLIPGGMKTAFFDARDDKYKPAADAPLNDPANVASAILFALGQPAGCAVRELLICSDVETSYP
jgi:NAD(P)-dependent dehydrogenase (short-subunit alcohol dehydrogenase family)